jgi:hypothetical protein
VTLFGEVLPKIIGGYLCATDRGEKRGHCQGDI